MHGSFDAFKKTGNSRSNHDISDLQVGKSELYKEALVPELELQVGFFFRVPSCFDC
jgi:hypothetical protein